MTKDKKARPSHRLFIQVRDYSRPITITPDNIQHIPVEWREVTEINLGSIKNPTKEIFKFKFEPIIYEEEV